MLSGAFLHAPGTLPSRPIAPTSGRLHSGEPHMRHYGWIAAALLVMGCSPPRVFMNDVNSSPTIAEAERFIADAQQVGADSLATAAITAARQALQAAKDLDQRGQRGAAQVEALRAQAEARYARASAERELARREEARARAALAALPSGGAR